MSRADFEDYVGLFEDAGWRHLDGSRHGGPQYFGSLARDADADIFSDRSSKAQRYLRSISAAGLVLTPLLAMVFILSAQGSFWPVAASPRDLYLTPGLWQMHGAEFVGAFLFESIFVALRVSAPLLLVGICVYFGVLMAYQYALYRRATALPREGGPAGSAVPK